MRIPSSQLVGDPVDFEAYNLDENQHEVNPAPMYIGDVIDRFWGERADCGDFMPWSKTHSLIKFRPGGYTCWCGINGHQKSLLLNMLTLGFVRQGRKTCIASFELTPSETLERIARQAVGVEKPTELYIHKMMDWLFSNLWFYNKLGTGRHQIVLGMLRYCFKELNMDHIIIDSLMCLDIPNDDYKQQKHFINELVSIARTYQKHVHLVTHPRKGFKESNIPTKFDVAGSGDITNLASNVVIVWKNKKPVKERDKLKADTYLHIDKQRGGSFEGYISLWFNPRSLQLVATKDRRNIEFLN